LKLPDIAMRLLAESERCISSDLERCAARFRRAAAWLALGMGIIVLAGWLLGVRTMQSFVPGWVTMKPNAAASLAAAGGALLLLEGAHTGGAWVRARLGVSRALGIVVALVGLLTLAEYLFAVDLGIDQLLFAASGDALTANPGRMAALTAAALAPLGFALVAATVSPPISHRVVQPLAFASGALALAALLGHLYGAIPVAGDGNGIQIAMHTAFGILLLSAATITVDTSRGWLPALFSPRPGGVLARRLLPVVLCIPIALGALRMTGEWFHIGGAMTASATVAVITMFSFGLVIWHTARALDIADAQWRAADRERVGLALSEAAARARADSEAAARRSAERVVREREEALALLDLVLDSSPVAFGLLDTDLRFRRVNPALAAFNGAPAADHIGRTVSHMLPDRGEAVEASCRQVLATGIPLTSAESVSTAPGAGRQRQWLSSTFPIPSSTGGMHGLGVMIIETTERRALEAQLHQAQKMEAVGQLAGGVAHDFNNLLTAIRAFSELAMLELPHDSPARSDVAEIALAADRASALTRQLLAFSRRQILQPVVLDPNDVVTGVTRLLARLIGPDIHCQPVLSKDAGHILADRGQLEQVIVNLAVNARDAMPHGGVLTIETANITVDERHGATLAGTEPPVPGDYVVLAVSDTGVGMDGGPLAVSSTRSSRQSPRAKAPASACPPCTASSGSRTASSASTAKSAAAPRSASICRAPAPGSRCPPARPPHEETRGPAAPARQCWSSMTTQPSAR
ncbi:MAG TPA: PAS domain-containing protein, partial [Gemmatimonadaceae bacterium]|nr:PAS domain-containing protein [Gemmatimonadaceae bacterium]